MGQHSPLEKIEKKDTGKDQPCGGNYLVRDNKNTPQSSKKDNVSWQEDPRDKKNTPQPYNVSQFQSKVNKDLHLSEKEDTAITTNTMFPLPKKERLGE